MLLQLISTSNNVWQQESDNRTPSVLDGDRSKQIVAITSNSSCNNLAGLRNKIKIRLSSASSTADMTSSCVEPPVPPPSSVVDGGTSRSTVLARNLTFNFSRRGRHAPGSASPSRRRVAEPLSVVQSTYLTLVDFVDLFRSFMLHARKDLRDLFDQQLATAASELLTPSSAVNFSGHGASVSSGSAAASSFPSFPVSSMSNCATNNNNNKWL